MLLMELEPETAGELLGALDSETIAEIVAEISCLTRGRSAETSGDSHVRDFVATLVTAKGGGRSEQFVEEIVRQCVGEDRSRQLLSDADRRAKLKDPFGDIRSAPIPELVTALAGESPQVIAIVLAELGADRSAKLLAELEDDVRPGVVQAMIEAQNPMPEAKLRMAARIEQRLADARQSGRSVASPEALRAEQLRRTAVLLRTMDAKVRTELMAAMTEQDADMATQVSNSMVLWEDIPIVADRGMQKALGSAEPRSLALALTDADETTLQKTRENISERAQGMMDEEMSLLSLPKADEIAEARENVLAALRELNASGELEFEQESDT